MLLANGDKNRRIDARYPNNQKSMPSPTVSLIHSSMRNIFAVSNVMIYGEI
jgi:hypothetical protein